jgi:transposase-like protein
MGNFNFQRPKELFVSQKKECVSGDCPACAKSNIKKYPVLSDQGWFLVIKCQNCLFSLSREKWNRLGYISLETDHLFPEDIET